MAPSPRYAQVHGLRMAYREVGTGDPGALLTGPLREQCRRWPAQHEVTVPGLHFLPEDSAPQIAHALTTWLVLRAD